MRSLIIACLLASLAGGGLAAQESRDARVDSLEAAVRELQRRLDSLRTPDTSALERVRAQARAAAGRTPTRDTTPAPLQAGRTRNLSELNPEISVTGDLRGALQTEGPQREIFELHEVEFSFQSALDPYSHTKIFAGLHEGEIEVEEGYFYYTGLPGRVRLDLGVFRQQVGELNRWHLHALPETDYPLALTTYMGEEGLAGAGVSAYWSRSGLGTHEVWAQLTVGSNEELFDEGDRPAYLLHVNNFWQLTRAAYAQVGFSVLGGSNPDENLDTRVLGVDARFTWRPPARARYREWTVRGELLAVEKQRSGTGERRYGWYIGTTYRLDQRWIIGVRFDYVEAPEGSLEIARQVVPTVTFWQSEWVKLHAEWRHLRVAGTSENLATLQAVWSIGPHRHETY